MRRFWPLLLVLGAGCGKWEAENWKQKFLSEVNYHYQTQQIKNAEIAARELEIENQRTFIVTLTERINQQDKEIDRLKEESSRLRLRLDPPDPAKPVEGKVTAVAGEIDLVVFSAGRDEGMREGMDVWISRKGELIGRVVIDRVDVRWSAGKLREKKQPPNVGDSASTRPPNQ